MRAEDYSLLKVRLQSAGKAPGCVPEHLGSLGKNNWLRRQLHFVELTDHSQEAEVELSGENAGRELPKVTLKQPSDGMRIPILIRG